MRPRSDRNRALATEAASRTVRLALIANLAEAWATYGADRDLLAIARDTAANARENVRLTRARLDGGVAPRTDLRQAEQILATAEDAIAAQTSALAQDENLIRLLVGGDVDRALLPAGTNAPPTVPPGLPAQLLERRPDIAAAERLVAARNADIGVAKAAYFPSLRLTGNAGFLSSDVDSLFSADSRTWSIGPSLALPVTGRAGVAVSEAQRDGALAGYEGAIQTAFRDVADALAVQGTIAERGRAAAANTAAAADTAVLTDARYKGGVDSFLSSLDAQRSLYAARRSEIATQLLLVQTRIALFRALGGDSSAGVETAAPR